MNLIGSYMATKNENFVRRVTASVVLAAMDIVHSDLDDGHPRKISSGEILRNPDGHTWIHQFVWRVAANAAIAGTVDQKGNVTADDNDIAYVVAGAFNEVFPDPEPPQF